MQTVRRQIKNSICVFVGGMLGLVGQKKKNTAKVQAIPTVTLKNRSHLVRATKLAIVEHNEKLTILHVTRLSSIERHRMPRLDAQPR